MTRTRSFLCPRFCRVIRGAMLVFAFLAPPALAGVVTLYARMHGTDALDPAARGDVALPAPRPPLTHRRLAVIVAGNRGTEITDTLPVLEVLEASGAFEVRIVAPARELSAFKSAAIDGTGLDFVPDLSFADYDRLVGRAPDLVVVPYLSAWHHEDAAVVPWIRAHVGPQTTLMSICAGAEIVAATGLFDGHEATAHVSQLARLAGEHPSIHYHHDVRWVRDRQRISSGAFTAGIDATLAAIDAIAGRPSALRAASVTSYPNLGFLDDPAAPGALPRAAIALETAYRWERTRVAVVIADGVSESRVAALLDAYAATMTADSVAVAVERRVITTEHGMRLVPRATTADLEAFDTITFATHARPGVDAYAVALDEVAHSHGAAMARLVGRLLNDPAPHPELAGGMPVGVMMLARVLLLGVAGLLTARLVTRERLRGLRASAAKELEHLGRSFAAGTARIDYDQRSHDGS